VLLDVAFMSLDVDALVRVTRIFNVDLSSTAVIHIGRAVQARDPFFSHVLHLIPDPAMETQVHDKAVTVLRRKEPAARRR
jgi:hypothetical protein